MIQGINSLVALIVAIGLLMVVSLLSVGIISCYMADWRKKKRRRSGEQTEDVRGY